ncbi:hypothetical protein BN2476_500143 [Paraburkholderia piptadeniae]|uniref:Uncharacterized protein n=1 Tax=Paraburkholderia piptadeniae TaxID=1701573 RepID=A0A1N7SH19_9BURK|nr:hypothetical protein BN2476_500143 [Paraburkholderia piptadeniae]
MRSLYAGRRLPDHRPQSRFLRAEETQGVTGRRRTARPMAVLCEEERLRDALDRRETDIRARHDLIRRNTSFDPVYRLDDTFIDPVKPAVIFSFRIRRW